MVIIGNFFGVSPAESRNIVGAHLMKRLAEKLPPTARLVLFVSSVDAWRTALGNDAPRCELVAVGSTRFAGRRWYEALYTQFVLPFKVWGMRGTVVFSPSPIFPVVLGGKNIVMIHDCAYRRFPQEASAPARLYVRAMYRAAAWWARKIVTISHFSARELETLYRVSPSRLVVVPNSLTDLPAVSDEFVRQTVERYVGGHPYFLYVGIVRYRKNLPGLIQAFASLRTRMPDARLVLVGRPDTRFLDVAAYAAKQGVVDSLIQTGFVSEEEKVALYRGAQALVLPSLYEGFGLQILEAQALGVPVVTSEGGATAEVGGDAALYVDPVNPRSITEGMVRAVEDRQLREELIRKGRTNIARFSWKQNVAVLLETFLGRAARPAGAPLRILEVNKYYAPTRGGVETVVQDIAELLTARGHRVDVLACADRPSRARIDRVNGIAVERAATLGVLMRAPVSIDLLWRFRRAVRSGTYDVVFLHHPYPPSFLAYALFGRRTPMVVWYHADIVRQRVVGALVAPLTRRVLRAAHTVFVSSHALTEHSRLLAPIKEKCAVVPFGIDPAWAAFTPEIEADSRPLIVSVGRAVSYKGFDYLIDAMADVPDARLIIVGDGPLLPALRRRAAEKSLIERVSFAGDRPDIRPYLTACDIFALPSTTAAEAFGIVQIEAMAYGKPVVNTSVPSGVPEVSVDGETGITVPPRDSAALAAALTKLVNDPALRARYGEAGKRRVANEFTKKIFAERVSAELERVLTPRN